MPIKISDLFIHPVKGFKRIPLDSMEVTTTGPLHDRCLMLIDENNRFLSQRSHPLMATIDVTVSDDKFCVSIPDSNPLVFEVGTTEAFKAVIWKDDVRVVACSPNVSQIISTYLQTPCRLVSMARDAKRILPEKYSPDQSEVQFADGFPFLLISQPSLDDLNTRLETPVSMDRFRPNIVVTGCEPYEEDQWESIQIGDITFDLPKPCSRCLVTTVNQETGQLEKQRGKSPLKALARYRNSEKGIMFGQNMVHKSTGTLNVGQLVKIIKKGAGLSF